MRTPAASRVARLGHGEVMFEDIAQSFFTTNGQDA
jgi:hypothetical protein